MRRYAEVMQDEGIAGSRTEDIEEAIDKLHLALSKCDYSNRRAFFSKTIQERLRDFSTAQSIADVTDTGTKTNSLVEQIQSSGDKDTCYYAAESAVVLVTRNTPGHSVLHHITGDREKYEKHCDKENERLGLTPSDVNAIVASSMREQNLRDQLKNSVHNVMHIGKLSVAENINGEFRVVDHNATPLKVSKSIVEVVDYAKTQKKVQAKQQGQSL